MEDNKLIAEFMGHKLGLDGDGMGEPQCRIFEKGLGTKRIEDTYSKSWDWLMPVVHKIDEKCREHLGLNHSLHIGDDIDAVHSQVVEFIKTYNDEYII